jgi:wobble nucleotide-excising tRNase
MAKDKKLEIKCRNLAPISLLSKEINTNSLQFAIYANNGQGKTFISSTFRLLENNPSLLQDKKGNILTDKFISFNKDICDFHFKISDSEGVKEDVKIKICKGKTPVIPTTKFIYHVFNQDYINENSKSNYDKDGNISDFIIGKSHIDVSEDEKEERKLEKNKTNLEEKLEPEISQKIKDKIDSIPNIKRLNEYKNYLNYNTIYLNFDKPWIDIDKSFKDYLIDYNKIKSVPEDLPKIQIIPTLDEDIEFIKTVIEKLKEKFSLSSLAKDFKQKITSKREFVEKGIMLLNNENKCPFCEQYLKAEAIDLIDNYTKFINDQETKTRKAFEAKKQSIANYIEKIKSCNIINNQSVNKFNLYANKYFTSSKNNLIENIDINELSTLLININKQIEIKIENISLPVIYESSLLNELVIKISSFNKLLKNNNDVIAKLNQKLYHQNEENKQIRKNLCKALFNELAVKYQADFLNIKTYIEDISALKLSIQKKKEQNKINKRDIVIKTIKSVLSYFFSDKYSLDKETFRLTFNKKTLKTGQAIDILSEGEKSIIAFAYYLGDTHMKITHIDDYSRLFFIFDDPISSMDFDHVYTLSGIIRELKDILNLQGFTRFFILTHNLEFMRILVSNKIAKKSFVLCNNELKEFNNTLTVPYIIHLNDLYKISIGLTKPCHTTANTIRHIIETITKFEHLELENGTVKKYIDDNFKHDIKVYSMINDLSHGAWRNEQPVISESDYILLCKELISHINKKYKSQIEYCKSKLS